MSDRSRLGTALAISVVLHVIVLVASGARVVERLPAEPASLLEVALVDVPVPAASREAPGAAPQAAPADDAVEAEPEAEPVVLPESRIVPMPEAGIEMPSEDARFLSDRDNIVAAEMVRRGEGLDRAGPDDAPAVDDGEEAALAAAEEPMPPLREEVPIAAAAAPEAGRRATEGERDLGREPLPLPGPGDAELVRDAPAIALADLMPRPGDVAAFAGRGQEGSGSGEAPPARPARNVLPGRRVRFSSGTGIATLLPSVRDGDVTLLNTKAHEFAPFVRRVATRIFQHLQIELFEAARSRVAGNGEEHALVRATMSADGRFLHATLVEARSDTRLAVPRMLLGVIGPRTFFDDNPPPGAVAEDGLIHFDLTIQLRVRSDDVRDAAGGRRAPLTQFEGYFGTGLR